MKNLICFSLLFVLLGGFFHSVKAIAGVINTSVLDNVNINIDYVPINSNLCTDSKSLFKQLLMIEKRLYRERSNVALKKIKSNILIQLEIAKLCDLDYDKNENEFDKKLNNFYLKN
jgi:hypothetical protein